MTIIIINGNFAFIVVIGFVNVFVEYTYIHIDIYIKWNLVYMNPIFINYYK